MDGYYCTILLCSLFIAMYAQSVTVIPSGETVAFEGGTATFTCRTSSGNISFRWLINEQPSDSFNSTSTGVTGVIGVLQLENISSRLNSSSIRCRVQDITSEPSLLKIQGTLERVGSLNITLSHDDSQVVLTWMSPFSLDVTGISPDIDGYCVNSMLLPNSSTVTSVCNIQEVVYTFPLPSSASPCDDFEFTVNAVNAVGSGAPGIVRLSETKEAPRVLSDDLAFTSDDGKVVRYSFMVSVPVCTTEVSAKDLENGDVLEDIPTVIIPDSNEVTFTAEQLESGRRYNVTVIASNIAGSSTREFTIQDEGSPVDATTIAVAILAILASLASLAILVVNVALWLRFKVRKQRSSQRIGDNAVSCSSHDQTVTQNMAGRGVEGEPVSSLSSHVGLHRFWLIDFGTEDDMPKDEQQYQKLIEIAQFLDDITRPLICSQVNHEVFSKAMLEAGFITVGVKMKASWTNTTLESFEIIKLAIEDHLISQAPSMRVKRCEDLFLAIENLLEANTSSNCDGTENTLVTATEDEEETQFMQDEAEEGLQVEDYKEETD